MEPSQSDKTNGDDAPNSDSGSTRPQSRSLSRAANVLTKVATAVIRNVPAAMDIAMEVVVTTAQKARKKVDEHLSRFPGLNAAVIAQCWLPVSQERIRAEITKKLPPELHLVKFVCLPGLFRATFRYHAGLVSAEIESDFTLNGLTINAEQAEFRCQPTGNPRITPLNWITRVMLWFVGKKKVANLRNGCCRGLYNTDWMRMERPSTDFVTTGSATGEDSESWPEIVVDLRKIDEIDKWLTFMVCGFTVLDIIKVEQAAIDASYVRVEFTRAS